MLGPFEVSAEDVARLGDSFTPAVNRLLETEAAAAGLAGYSLVPNSVETTPDGGVDTAIRGAPSTGDWIPEGDSVWQFKRSALAPGKCADEFGKAVWAQARVRAGSAYVMVLGGSLNDHKLAQRRTAILGKAAELDISLHQDRLRVYDAGQLARWMSLYPSLAISVVMGRRPTESGAVDISTWASSRAHQMEWTPDEARNAAIRVIRDELLRPHAVSIHVAGSSGVGKTRLVLEALRDGAVAPLVVYIADEAKMGGGLVPCLVRSGRRAVLVVDECAPDRHALIAEQLPSDPRISLLTIGEGETRAGRTATLPVTPMPRSAINELLSRNFPKIPHQTRQVIVPVANGHPRDAEAMACRMMNPGATDQATDLAAESSLEIPFVGNTWRVAAGVALFQELGWDGEVAAEREQLQDFLGLEPAAFLAAATELEQNRSMTVRGRYRLIAPHPVAVRLAADLWQADASRIIGELLPGLSSDMALSLFRRLADLGKIATLRNHLRLLLDSDGPFGSLGALRVRGARKQLAHLAIVLPQDVALHVSELIEAADDDELRDHQAIRSGLVWTLGKLAWHTDTFKMAADSLLRLALVETDGYVNNATGTWTSLFGTLLPTTAAGPEMRLAYLRRYARSQDVRKRFLAVSALGRALMVRETSTTSAQSQGGVPVEPPGRPATRDEAWGYQAKVIEELGRLASDDDPSVQTSAAGSLVRAINPLAGAGTRWDALMEVIVRTPSIHRQARRELQDLREVYERSSRFGESSEAGDRRITIQALSDLEASLPVPSTHESLVVTLSREHSRAGDDRQIENIVGAITRYLEDHAEAELLGVLRQRWPAARALGTALARLDLRKGPLLDALATGYEENPGALQCYLRMTIQQGDPQAVEAFLDSRSGQSLSDIERLEVASIDQSSHQVRELAAQLATTMPVAEAARRVRPTSASMPWFLKDWSTRIETQQDYNALIDWLRLVPHPLSEGIDQETILAIVLRRRDLPEVAATWAWAQLARAVLHGNEEAIADLVLYLIEPPHCLIVVASDEEAQLLTQALHQRTETVWKLVAERLQAGSGYVAMSTSRWRLLNGLDTAAIHEWIGDDLDCARLVARITHPGTDEPTPLSRYLLDKFGADQEVQWHLYGNLISGIWSGHESDRLKRQTVQLNSWRTNRNEPLGVRQWAAQVTRWLADSQRTAPQREAEHFLR